MSAIYEQLREANKAACHACGSPLFWLAKLPSAHLADASKPRLHCAGCKPPPSPVFVDGWLMVVWESGRWQFEDFHPDPASLAGLCKRR